MSYACKRKQGKRATFSQRLQENILFVLAARVELMKSGGWRGVEGWGGARKEIGILRMMGRFVVMKEHGVDASRRICCRLTKQGCGATA